MAENAQAETLPIRTIRQPAQPKGNDYPMITMVSTLISVVGAIVLLCGQSGCARGGYDRFEAINNNLEAQLGKTTWIGAAKIPGRSTATGFSRAMWSAVCFEPAKDAPDLRYAVPTEKGAIEVRIFTQEGKNIFRYQAPPWNFIRPRLCFGLTPPTAFVLWRGRTG
jgi:hypothetical protein